MHAEHFTVSHKKTFNFDMCLLNLFTPVTFDSYKRISIILKESGLIFVFT